MGRSGVRGMITAMVVALGLAFAGAASAQDAPKLGRTEICVTGSGHVEPGVCKVIGSGSMRNNSCRCPKGGRATPVSICERGMKAPVEDKAFRQFRAKAAKDGTLVGTTWQDQPVCVKR